MSSSQHFERYGEIWKQGTDPLKIEMYAIQKGGKWKNSAGKECGEGLSHHYEQMRRIIWPWLDDHRWHRLTRDAMIHNKVSVLVGSGSTGKTHSAAWYYLCEYFCFSDEICIAVSSTTKESLKKRVFGEIVSLHSQAIERFPYLPGHHLDSANAITTDELEDEDGERKIRDMRKGIFGIACKVGGKEVGLSSFVGIKQKKIRLVGDEIQFMQHSYLSAFANLNNNIDFKATLMGNPSDQFDPLGVAAEPLEGWESKLEPEKTDTWTGKFYNAFVVNLVGTDSPNFDFPDDEKDRYPYLIGRKKIQETLTAYKEDSYEYYSQCKGVMKVANMTQRVISRQMCEQHGALLSPQWGSQKRTKIMSIDAAYGGDRCVAGEGEFGISNDGKTILAVGKPIIIPVSVKSSMSPEDQIAEWVFKYSTANDIPPDRIFYDSTGRGSLGAAFARVFGYSIPVPVEFGGKPTKRPVRADFYIRDHANGSKRLKRCDEHYDRFVTELWFSARYAIEAGQIRGLSSDHVYEGSMRQYKDIAGNKVSIETKDDMKERLRRSPDMFDQFVTLIEGARRLGFNIARLGSGQEAEIDSKQWLRDLDRKARDLNESKQLQYN